MGPPNTGFISYRGKWDGRPPGKCEIIWFDEGGLGKGGHKEIGGVSTERSAGKATLNDSSALD